MEEELKCRNCGGLAVMVCKCNTAKALVCKNCLQDHLIGDTQRTHTLLPLKARPFLQNKTDERKFFERMKCIDELTNRLSSRLERLRSSKEYVMLQFQLADEEFRKLMEEELNRNCAEISDLSANHEEELKKLIGQLEEIRYAANYDEMTLAGRLIHNSELADQLFLEPLDFSIRGEDIMNVLPRLIHFYFRKVQPANYKLVYPDIGSNSIIEYIPETGQTYRSKVSARLKSAAGVCILSDGTIFIAGGRLNGASSKEAGQLEPGSLEYNQILDMNTPRDSFAIVNYENCVLVFGGWQQQEGQAISECEKYDSALNEWIGIQALEEAMSPVCAVRQKHLVYVAGGRSHYIHVYDPAKDQYQEVIDMPQLGPMRLLASEDGLVVIQRNNMSLIRLETETFLKETPVPFRTWWGCCLPVIWNDSIYFLEHDNVWSYSSMSLTFVTNLTGCNFIQPLYQKWPFHFLISQCKSYSAIQPSSISLILLQKIFNRSKIGNY